MPKTTDVDMTEGSIAANLIRFAIPLMIGNLFQQLYNMVDAWVVGNYVSNEAYSAVGTVGSVVNMLVMIFTGLAGGAGVVISQYYGAKKEEKVRETVHTFFILTVVLGVIFTFIGVGMVPFFVEFMKTPAIVVPQSTAYLRIIFMGMIGCTLYNMGAGILRAIGDSTRPFLFLVISALLNIGLDLLFVLKFRMGVEGVAYATIISQAVSALLVLIILFRTESCVKLSLRNMRVDMGILKSIVRIGIPTAIQLSVTSFSNVFVQSYINFFGEDCMSGWTTYSKVDQIIMLPVQSIGLAVTTFVAQNIGINNVNRAKKGITYAMLMSLAGFIILLIPILIFAPGIVMFFNDKAEVIEYGSMFLRWMSPFYAFMCVSEIISGALRGTGNTKVPMIIRLISFVAVRQLYLFVMSNYISNEIMPLAFGYPFGWFLACTLLLLYYKRAKLSANRVVN